MVATARRTASRPRVMRHVQPSSPIDGLQLVRFAVAEGSKEDTYLALHWTDSCEVKIAHSDDEARSYVVTCSATDGTPVRCTCPAANFRGTGCRHRAAVTKLMAMGFLTVPTLDDAGHDRSTTE